METKSVASELFTRRSVTLFLLVVSISILFGFVPRVFLVCLTDAALFGDSFGFLNAVLSACAFAGVIATLVLQMQELRETREQYIRSADAQEKQLDLAAVTSYFNVLARCIDSPAQTEYLMEVRKHQIEDILARMEQIADAALSRISAPTEVLALNKLRSIVDTFWRLVHSNLVGVSYSLQNTDIARWNDHLQNLPGSLEHAATNSRKAILQATGTLHPQLHDAALDCGKALAAKLETFAEQASQFAAKITDVESLEQADRAAKALCEHLQTTIDEYLDIVGKKEV